MPSSADPSGLDVLPRSEVSGVSLGTSVSQDLSLDPGCACTPPAGHRRGRLPRRKVQPEPRAPPGPSTMVSSHREISASLRRRFAFEVHAVHVMQGQVCLDLLQPARVLVRVDAHAPSSFWRRFEVLLGELAATASMANAP